MMASSTSILLQLTDSHLGGTWGRAEPVRALDETIAAARRLPQAPDAVIFTGDLSDRADVGDYRLVAERLAVFDVPVHYLVGNHDDRANMRAALELPGSGEQPLNWDSDVGPVRLVGLDTHRPGHDGGQLDRERLEWLDRTLAAADAPTIVATHHPPFLTGIAAADQCALPADDRVRFAEVLRRHSQVVRVISGHVHRAFAGAVAGRPAVIAPSIYTQGALDFIDPEPELPFDPPGFALHLYAGGALHSHFQFVAAQVTPGLDCPRT